MKKVGFIGWRGMVGSVLMNRMREEDLFKGYEAIFFTTSQAGQKGPDVGMDIPPLQDAYDLSILKSCDIIVTCQGSGHTNDVHPKLRNDGWDGYWIDAASALRMEKNSIIVLDPVNRAVIDRGLSEGIKDYIGGNCTVSLMLMGINGLFNKGLVEWISSMTYQAASGAGAQNMRELVSQMKLIGTDAAAQLENPSGAILELDKQVSATMKSSNFPVENFGAPLAGSLIPWIDSAMDNGQTREEWKGYAETNKILKADPAIPIDGICVRIGAMRSHCQALTLKLTKDISVQEIESIIAQGNDWVKVIPNEKEASIKELSPAAISGTLTVPVGRIRKMNMGPEYVSLFTAGDQLLWGAAEPVMRMFKILLEQ